MTHLLSIIAIAAQLVSAPPSADGAGATKPARSIEHASEDGQRVVDGLGTILAEKLSALDRRRLGSKVLSESRVSIVSGTFAGGATRLVAVNVELRRKDPEAAPQYISGMFTVTDAGTLIAVVVSPRMRPEALAFDELGDTDGDGSDDFVYTATNTETSTSHRVSWNGTEVVDEARPAKPAEDAES